MSRTRGIAQGRPMNDTPKPVRAEITNALALLFDADQVVELRAFHKGSKKRTDAGYFDGAHRKELADAAMRLSAANAAVYVTLNAIDPQLLGRCANRIKEYAADTTTDANVTRRRWLLIDLDPVRPKDTSATKEQVAAATAKARVLRDFLKAASWPAPASALSGNGYHLLYPIDLPNNAESTALVKGALQGLAAKFDDAAIKVDQAVFNAGRIVKLHGTVANKGDHTETMPWRLSQIRKEADRSVPVTPEQLRALAPQAEAPKAASPAPATFDLGAFLGRLGIDYEADTHEGRDRYKLAYCPFNADHGKGESAIFRGTTGALGFKCQHNSCADKTWQDVRALLDGSRELRRPIGGSPHAQGSSTDAAWPEPQPLTAKIDPLPYPLDALPGIIGAAVAEVQAFVQAPAALVASCAMSAVSVAAQALYDVERGPNLSGPTSLWVLVVAESGERKSTVDGYFTQAVNNYETDQAEAAKPAIKEYTSASAIWNSKYAGLKDSIKSDSKSDKPTKKHETLLRELEDDRPKEPRVPRLLYDDATPEKLGFNLAKQWPSGAILSDEGGTVLGAHGMGKDSIMRNLALLNKLWDGRTMKVDRKTSESFAVKGARLTIGIAIQEPTLRSFFEQSKGLARGTGFLARFLVAWPESTMGYRPFSDAPTWACLETFNRRITAILNQEAPIDDDGSIKPVLLTLAPAAHKAWRAFHDRVERQLRPGSELFEVRDVAAKIADNAARMAALFHVFEGDAGPVSLDAFTRAARIAGWYLHEARRFFGELALPLELANAVRLDAWLLAYCRRESTHLVPKREAQQFGPVRDKTALDAAISTLNELDRVRIRQDGKRKFIAVNPALLGFATATVATVATVAADSAPCVASVASVAVANAPANKTIYFPGEAAGGQPPMVYPANDRERIAI